MPRLPTPDEDAMLRTGLALLGVVLLASAALAFDIARGHIAVIAELCGRAEPHCGWCYAAAGFALAGAASLLAAVRPARRPAEVPARRA